MVNLKENIRIYSFYYKKTKIPIADNIYIPVMAGNNSKIDDHKFVGDDTGENISDRNDYYSELTGLFWIWKNTNQDIVGSCHYRRYFTSKKYPFKQRLNEFFFSKMWFYKKRAGIIYAKNISKYKSYILNEDEITHIMQSVDVILPRKRVFKYSIKEHYRKYHNLNDLEIVEDIIQAKCPDFLSSFHQVLNNKWLYANNMFIIRQNNFNALMEWLFDILFEFENRVDTKNYVGYQKRILGFISERLITVWFNYQNIKIKELPIIYFKKLKYR